MKTINLGKIAEPLIYIILVAVVGFIATVVNHTKSRSPATDTELVSLDMEKQFKRLMNGAS